MSTATLGVSVMQQACVALTAREQLIARALEALV